MKVILLENVKKMGQKGDILEVADGYANSYLIPRKLAKTANESDMIRSQEISKNIQAKELQAKQANTDLFQRINKKKIEVDSPSSPSGSLFAAVGKGEIGAELPGLKSEHIVLKQGIKEIGDYEIPIIIGKNKGHIALKIK